MYFAQKAFKIRCALLRFSAVRTATHADTTKKKLPRLLDGPRRPLAHRVQRPRRRRRAADVDVTLTHDAAHNGTDDEPAAGVGVILRK